MKFKYLEVLSVFTEEDIKFNRKMVDCALDMQREKKFPERRGGKMPMRDHQASGAYAGREYDCTSEVINEFRRKWGIL